MFFKKKEKYVEEPNKTVRILTNIGYEPYGELSNYTYERARDIFGETKHRHPKMALIDYNYEYINSEGRRTRNDITVNVYAASSDPELSERLGGKTFKLVDYCYEEVWEEAFEMHIYDLIDEGETYGFNLEGLLDDIYNFIDDTVEGYM